MKTSTEATPQKDPESRSGRRFRLNFNSIALAIVVIATLWAALQSSSASNHATEAVSKVAEQNVSLTNQQHQLTAIQTCTQRILFRAIDALNQRTQYTGAQADANIDLQRSQLRLLLKGLNPKSTQSEREAAFHNYVDDLQNFVTVVTQAQNSQTNNPYPTPAQYARCLTKAQNSPEGVQ